MLRCVEYLREHPPKPSAIYHVVLGSMNQDAGQIKEIAAGLPYIMLHQEVSDMCGLMLQCDLAVSAGGTTLYELCACGLPTVTYILADNQIQAASAFEEAELMPCAGDVRRDNGFVERVFLMLDALGSQKLREETSRRMRTLVDGCGAARLAEAVMNCFLLHA